MFVGKLMCVRHDYAYGLDYDHHADTHSVTLARLEIRWREATDTSGEAGLVVVTA